MEKVLYDDVDMTIEALNDDKGYKKWLDKNDAYNQYNKEKNSIDYDEWLLKNDMAIANYADEVLLNKWEYVENFFKGIEKEDFYGYAIVYDNTTTYCEDIEHAYRRFCMDIIHIKIKMSSDKVVVELIKKNNKKTIYKMYLLNKDAYKILTGFDKLFVDVYEDYITALENGRKGTAHLNKLRKEWSGIFKEDDYDTIYNQLTDDNSKMDYIIDNKLVENF